ncbi:hypothetical protein ABT297_06350 [Dactylosporangium sp. NPDC000555]|uniref:hypothetical protein n=1 Tax=Dactylosporangium sp. NPDC000555 TaxID=3154260 RepID=UPI003328D3E1
MPNLWPALVEVKSVAEHHHDIRPGRPWWQRPSTAAHVTPDRTPTNFAIFAAQ